MPDYAGIYYANMVSLDIDDKPLPPIGRPTLRVRIALYLLNVLRWESHMHFRAMMWLSDCVGRMGAGKHYRKQRTLPDQEANHG
jgi:hypothetical protein